jgi:hypothetical protein
VCPGDTTIYIPVSSGRQRIGFAADPASDSIGFRYGIPVDDTGVQATIFTTEADPDLSVKVGDFTKWSEGYYRAKESVTFSSGDGATPGALSYVSIYCYNLNDFYQARTIPGVSVIDTGRCAGVLEVFSFADLVGSFLRPIIVPMASSVVAANGSLSLVPSTRYFRFRPAAGAIGVSIALSFNPGADPATMDLFVSLFATDGWPGPGKGLEHRIPAPFFW